MSLLHVESTYGFYHGQDPRTFTPDVESCTEIELATHKSAVELADRGEWLRDDSGCHIKQINGNWAKILKTSMGIGTYCVVLNDEGDFIRDASYEDIQREGEWEEFTASDHIGNKERLTKLGDKHE